MFKARHAIDNNESLPEYPTLDPGSANPFVEYNDQDETQDFSDVTHVTQIDSHYLVWFMFP